MEKIYIEYEEFKGEFMKDYTRRIYLDNMSINVEWLKDKIVFYFKQKDEKTKYKLCEIDYKLDWLAEVLVCAMWNVWRYRGVNIEKTTQELNKVWTILVELNLIKIGEKELEEFVKEWKKLGEKYGN